MPDDDKTRLPDENPKSSLFSEGQVFGPYKVIRLLGRGGMGEVYEVEHGELGTRHALKLINAEIVDRPDAKERFKREARVMARLRHPHIVHVDDFGELDGHIWLRMDLMDGWNYQGKTYHSLQDLMRDQGALPEPLVRRLLGEILDGLGFAHEAGAVHRDLKPANLLLDEEGRMKITDFGLVSLAGADWLQSQVQLTVARSMADPDATRLEIQSESARSTDSTSSLRTGSGQAGTSTQALLGTFAYMSPEHKKGGEVDARSDLYAIGLMGFQMLTEEETPGFEVPSDLVEDLNPSWDDWVKKALATRADRRFESAAAMRQFLAFRTAETAKSAEPPSLYLGESKAKAADRPQPSDVASDQGKFRQPEKTHLVIPEGEISTIPSLPEPAGFNLKLSDKEILEMVWVQPGKFTMGSPKTRKRSGFMGIGAKVVSVGEESRWANEAQHEVVLTHGYWLGRYPVTQGQWEVVMGSNPSEINGGDLPVEQVSWEDAMVFCRKLTEREGAKSRLPEGYEYTLPTEAQWEYACRAGTTGAYAGDLDAMGWYSGNAGGKTHPVGQKRANAWGFYDMHGNVYEWCGDWFGEYPRGSVVDPTGPTSGSYRVNRGGSWCMLASACRSADRGGAKPGERERYFGFRLALAPVHE